MGDREYIITSKALSKKLVEHGYYNSLIKIEGDNYYFEPLQDIQDLIDLYNIDKTIINDALSDVMDTTKVAEPIIEPIVDNVVEPVIESVTEKNIEPVPIVPEPTKTVIKSGRIKDQLVKRGFPVINSSVSKNTNKKIWFFPASEELDIAFKEILDSLPKYEDIVLSPFERKFIVDMMEHRRDEMLQLGIKSVDTIDTIINKLMGKPCDKSNKSDDVVDSPVKPDISKINGIPLSDLLINKSANILNYTAPVVPQFARNMGVDDE